MPIPDSISGYLRTFTSELGERILESFPPLHAVDVPPSPMIRRLLRRAYPAQILAIMGLVRRWQRARAGAVIAECGTGKTLISLGAVHTHAEGRRFSSLAMVPPQLVEKWARESFLTLPSVRVFLIDGLRTPTSAKGHYGVNEVKLRNGRIVREGLKTSLSELRLRKASPSARKRWDEICRSSAVFVVGRDRAKLGYFWRHAYSVSRSGRYQGCVVKTCPNAKAHAGRLLPSSGRANWPSFDTYESEVNMAEKGFFIANLPRDGVVTFLALVRDKELKPKRNGGMYLHLVLADRTGELDAKAWDCPQEIAALFERDDIVKVRGTIELYNERPQLIVQRARRCEDGEFQETDFCPASVHDPEEMFAELRSFVESVVDANLRSLLISILEDADVAAPLSVAPAAMRVHHAFRSGLLEHTVSLCGLTEAIVRRYPRLNRDLLIAGAILHDIGKVEELEVSRRLGYTTRGQLVGHVVLGLEILERHTARLQGFPVELKSVLQHLIVSHHGELDKGALKQPMLPEALAFSIMDLLDARLEQAWMLIDQAPKDEEWTVYAPSLGRQLYRWRPDEAAGVSGGSSFAA